MASDLTNDNLDDLEVELAQVEQTLRLLDDEQVDPVQAIAWISTDTAEGDGDGPLAPVVVLPIRPQA